MDSNDWNKVCFNVRKEPLCYHNQEGNLNVIDNNIAIVRTKNDGTDEILNLASSSYNLVQNSSIVEGLESLRQYGFEPHKVRNINNKKFMFEMRREEDLYINNQPCLMRVQITNSYDGSTKLGLNFGVFIKVCSNGLIVNLNDAKLDLAYKHSSIVPSDISNFVYSKTIQAKDYLNYKLRNINFDNDPSDVERKFDKLKSMFYKPQKQENNPVIDAVLNRTAHEMEALKEYGVNEEFALFMAITNMATHADKYMLSSANAMKLEQAATELWTNFSLQY